MSLPRRPQPRPAEPGFTLMEMVITTAIFLGISATAVSVSRTVLDREDLNAMGIGLAGWLEAIQRGAQRTTGGCRVTFSQGMETAAGTNLRPGDTLATVTPGTCTNESSFTVPEFRSDSLLNAKISTFNSIDFTPRGTIVQSISSTAANILPAIGPVVTLSLGQANMTRCVRISHTSGMVTVGANNNGTSCSNASFDGSI
jgi:prepilin-type N-terminal cleavage/methylation domain-containing protein